MKYKLIYTGMLVSLTTSAFAQVSQDVIGETQIIVDELNTDLAENQAPSVEDPALAIDDMIKIDTLDANNVSGDENFTASELLDLVESEVMPGAMVTDAAQTPKIAEALIALLEQNALQLDEDFNQGLLDSYVSRKGELLFVTNPTNVALVDEAQSQVKLNGLPEVRYDVNMEPYEELYGVNDVSKLALQELKYAIFVHKYSRDMERGIVDFDSLGSLFDLDPKSRDYAQYLADFKASPQTYFQDLEPKDPAWPVLKQEYDRLLRASELHPLKDVPLVPADKTLKLGVKSDAVINLRQRLNALGYLTGNVDSQNTSTDSDALEIARSLGVDVDENAETVTDTSVESEPVDVNNPLFDEELYNAVRAFQAENNLTADGIAGLRTLHAINTGPEQEMEGLLIAMERLRWGPQNTDGRQIFVNIANYNAEVRDDNVTTFETSTVVGKVGEQFETPEFHDEMEYLVINPRWYVPRSIIVNEYLPRWQAGRGLGSTYKLMTSGGQTVDFSKVDFNKYTKRTFPYRLVQENGPSNALGNVKFIFPNKHNIYLHDSPQKALFGRTNRAFSHGCIRIADPIDLATTLLAPYYSDPRGTYDAIRATKKERYVELKEHVPVFLTYFTTIVDKAGQIQRIPDVYNRDPIVAEALRNQGLNI